MLQENLTAACLLVASAFVACDPDPEPQPCSTDSDCGGDAPLCDLENAVCEALPAGHPIGWRDGAADSVDFTLLFESDGPETFTDLAFNPSNPSELWVVNAKDDSVSIITRPGEADSTTERKRDPDASHFMNAPPAFAFGATIDPWGQTFGVCGNTDGGNHFMGPALFSAEPEIFALDTPGGLGSHLDMLHSTSFCRGIAWAEANIFFTFNSELGTIDKYDFVEDHGPGNDDHSDGKIWRFVEPTVTGAEDDVPSHVIYDPVSKKLYIADTGTGRVLFLDTATGAEGASFSGDEPVRRRYVEGATFGEVVPAGTLVAPSGVELHDGLLYVTDSAQSRFYAFDLDGDVVRTLDTGGAPGTLAGMTFGPDGKVYFVDRVASRVYRIDPK